jgi:hypothetical protein
MSRFRLSRVITMKGIAMESDGVFLYLIDQAAFIDRAILSIDGKKRKRPHAAIEILQNLPIGGPGRLYARSLHFRHLYGGNPGELKYGTLSNFSSVPSLMLVLRSSDTPLTAAQVVIMENSLLRRNFRAYLSTVELTFDISGYEVHEICQKLVAGNRLVRNFLDDEGRETLYIGSPKSSRQLRVYQKTEDVVRLEFVLRLSFLRNESIQQPCDLLKLSNAEMWQKILPPCPLRKRLRKMQRALMW